MKKTLSIVIIGILFISMFSIFAPKALGTASETSLQVAEKAATWTISQAISENGGYKWANYLQGGPRYVSTVPFGGSGFGTFYLKLYKQTGNTLYLDYAKGAAHWVISQAVSDSGGYKWPQPDDDIPSPGWWLSPMVSGIGDFLLSMYQTTGDITYREYAAGAARWLMAMAYWGEAGCFIPYNPPGPYGTQAAHGIAPGREAYTATFLLHMYQETKDTTYLPYIRGTAEWLISGPDKVVDANGYKWRFNRPYGSVYPPDGNGQIALFFYEIYEALGDPTYLQYAQGTINWLLSQAVINGNTAKWYDPVTGLYMTLPLSDMGGMQGFWGIPEPNCLLMAVYGITKNPTYLDYAKKLANWITSSDIAVSEGGGYKFPNYQGSSFYSAYQNAKIYNFLSWLSSLTGETTYSNYADGALQWIIFSATESNGGYAWRTIPYFPYNAAWFQSGAAGVGYYLASATTIDRSMVGYWKFDEGVGGTASDSSGNGNTGTVGGAQWVDGVQGKALRFDGVDDYVYVPHSSSLDLDGYQMSVEFWMKLGLDWHSGIDHENMCIYDKGDAYTSSLIASSGALRFNLAYVPVRDIPETTKNSWADDTWFHIAEVYDDPYIKIYVNGVLDHSEPVSGPIPHSGFNLCIGAHSLRIAQIWFNGVIDEFAIYNYARTAEEISGDYNSISRPRILAWGWSVHVAGGIDREWTFPNGGTFTFRSWLQSKGYSVFTEGEAFPDGIVTLSRLQAFSAILLYANVLGQPGNNVYDTVITDYVNRGGGLIIPTNYDDPAITIDDAFGFSWIADPWSFLVDAGITDPTHPIMQGITELPKAAGVFLDWDALINETPLPPGTAVLARSTWYPLDKIALMAFEYGAGKVVVGPADGLMRPYGPTNMDWWDVIAEPAIENKLLLNAINWAARSLQPDFEISVSPDMQIGQPDSSVYCQIAVTSLNGFSSSVDLGASFSPNPLSYGYHILPTATVTPPPDGRAIRTLEFEIYSDTPLKTYTITVTATSGSKTKTDSTTVNVERSLEVPYQNQGYANWCGPTSLAMVIRYYGEDFHSWDYASDKNLRTNTGIGDLNDLGAYVNQYYPTLSVESRSYGILNKGLIFADAKTDLSSGYPILLALGKPPTPIISQAGHVVMIVGVNESGIFVNDPSGYLFSDLATTTPLPWPYIHAYIDWSKVEPFIVTWPYTSTLTVKGAPDPEDKFGTMYITTYGDICFFQPDGNQLTKDYYDLSLNQGLRWNHTAKSELDPVINRKCSSLYAHLSVSNSRPIEESFTASCRILCPNNLVHPLQVKEINAVPAFSVSGVYWRLDGLDDLLPKGGPYYLEFELSNSNGVEVDHFITEPFYWQSQSVKLKEKRYHLYLHVYDTKGNHIGLDYTTGQIQLGVAGAYYFDDNNGTIMIVVPQIIDLKIIIDAQYAEEPVESYDLSITLSTDAGVFEQTCSRNITAGEIQTFTTESSEAGLNLYYWQYIFRDSRRGTELKINAIDKYFQFIASDKDFGVKYDPKMIVYRSMIAICYKDSEILMTAIAATGKIVGCTATLLDRQTSKLYWLFTIQKAMFC